MISKTRQHTWARCGVASIVRVDAWSMLWTKSGIVWSERITLHNILHMEGFTVKPLTLWLIGGHDVLLDTAHVMPPRPNPTRLDGWTGLGDVDY